MKFNYYDKFYNFVCKPMHLIQFSVFNQMIDEMVKCQGCLVTHDDTLVKETEFINFKKFKNHITEFSAHAPLSLFHFHVLSENSPFIKMMCLNDVFIVRNNKEDDLFSARISYLENPDQSINQDEHAELLTKAKERKPHRSFKMKEESKDFDSG